MVLEKNHAHLEASGGTLLPTKLCLACIPLQPLVRPSEALPRLEAESSGSERHRSYRGHTAEEEAKNSSLLSITKSQLCQLFF